MTPQEVELNNYYYLCLRLNQIEETLQNIMHHKEYCKMHKLMNEGIMLCSVYIKDAKSLLSKYAERSYEP